MRRRNRNHKKLNWYGIIIFFGIVLAVCVYVFFFQGTLPSLNPAAYFPTPTLTPVPENPLKGIVNKELKGAQGTYAIVVKNLKNGRSYSYNAHKSFNSASLYKAWVMAAIYEKIEAGKLKEDTVLEADIAELNREFGITPEVAEQTSGTTSYTVHDALVKMITISDNYASLLLTHEITYDGIEFFLMKYGMKDSQTGQGDADPTTTAYDEALFYENLYNGKLANKENTKKMIELLKRNEFKTVIPKYIPVPVAHKTGALENVSHDAGIVFTPKGDYVMAVLSDSGVPPAAEERMAHISEGVYQYFQTLPDEEIQRETGAAVLKILVWSVVGAIFFAVGRLYWMRRKERSKRIF